MAEPRCIGIDFGTDSVRVVLVRADTGIQEGRAVAAYPRWSEGRYSDARGQPVSASIPWTTPRAWSVPAGS